jgi:hypothetical protein
MRRILISTLALGLLLATVRNAAAQDDAKEIVRKAIAAHGGADKLNKFKGYRESSKGTISIGGMELEFTVESVTQLPDKQKSSIKLDVMGMAVNIVQMANGDKFTLTVNGNSMPVTDVQKSDAKESMDLDRMLNLTPLLSDKGFAMKTLPPIKVDGKDAVGIEVDGPALKGAKIYFDKETSLTVKAERKAISPENPGGGEKVTQEAFMRDYKDVNGIKKPMKMTVQNDGKKFIESTVTKAEAVEKVDDKEFSD